MPPSPDLIGLKNLGPRSLALLAAAGITSFEQLRQLGAVRAYARVKASGVNNASLNLLWALEGALNGEHWQVVAREHRLSLLLALEALQGRQTSTTVAAHRPSGPDRHRKNS
jgi:DNA transformation protein